MADKPEHVSEILRRIFDRLERDIGTDETEGAEAERVEDQPEEVKRDE